MQSCHKMSPCNACRSFAIYLVIVFILTESPASSFTVKRRRTTTLSSSLDLTGEESALLEVKSDISKLHQERGDVKYGRDKPTIRKSANFLSPDKKSASTNGKTTITSTTVNSNKHDDTQTPFSELSITNETEKTMGFKSIQTNVTEGDFTLNLALANKEQKTDDATTKKDSFAGHRQQDLGQIRRGGSISRSPDYVRSTTFSTKTTNNPKSSSNITMTTSINENDQDTKKIEFMNNEKKLTKVDLSKFESEKLGSIGDKNKTSSLDELKDIKKHEPSKISTINSTRKKYTVIERKRIIPTTEMQYRSTEKAEELENAESISSKITLENVVNVTPIESLEELRQELISNSRTATNKNVEDLDTYLTTQTTINVLEPETKQLPSTISIPKDTTAATELKTDFVSSKRGGYLNLKQPIENEEIPTTESLEDGPELNKTVIEPMFEVETQENEPEVKNSTKPESQNQLAEKALKEILLQEKLFNDRLDKSKKYEEQDTNKATTIAANDDDALSVKPILQGKGSLYTVNSNYKKMKKIEVQPSKPFVRDPDDNSWRNESLTSLGIVFKAKNASKPFTQVLKNKTEAELNNVIQSEKDNTNEVPDLRQRLEKIAEVRKSRKKKIDKFGDTVYSDYEENSGEVSSTPKTVTIPIMEVAGEIFFAPTTALPTTKATFHTTASDSYKYKEDITTKKPHKTHKFAEYYDTTDEYDADYINLSKIDLKKFTTRLFALSEKTATTSPMWNPFTKPMIGSLPERKPTVQYFPPREQPMRGLVSWEQKMRENSPKETPPVLPKVSLAKYNDEIQPKVNIFTQDKTPNDASPVTYATLPPETILKEKTIQMHRANPSLPYEPANLDKNIYVTFPSRMADHGNRYPGTSDESLNRPSYAIKHYKDLINDSVKDEEFLPAFTETPQAGITMTNTDIKKHMDDYDYDENFRKDIISRFADNFNRQSERFKVDFPILYNNTVVHMKTQEDGKVVASSSAFMKRLYADPPLREPLLQPCDPHCEMNLDLSPAYELHYYVPDQEEKQEPDLKPVTLPFAYRL